VVPELSEKARLVADRYEEAYFRANDSTISLVASGSGWYKLELVGDHSRTRYRLSDIEEMATRLEAVAAERETAAVREGYVILAIPPRNAKNRNLKNAYLATGGKWITDKTDPAVEVYENSTTASIIANELNSRLPFEFVIIEPF
jgi:hypothetical protein